MIAKTQLWKGILEGCILTEIGRHPTYGYGIVEYLRKNGFTEVTEGTVYPLLLRLEKQGLLQSELHDSPLGPQRKYYALSPEGEADAKRFAADWATLQRTVEGIVKQESAKNPAGDSLLPNPDKPKKKGRVGFGNKW